MDPQRAQPRCQEDEAIDAISLQCAGAVDDYIIVDATYPISWYDATVRCADDGQLLIIGAGAGFAFDDGMWDSYRCATIGMPDTAAEVEPETVDEGILMGVVVLIVLIIGFGLQTFKRL